MAFAGSEDVMNVIETLVKEVWNEVFPGSIDEGTPFVRMTYNDAMTKVITIVAIMTKVRERQT